MNIAFDIDNVICDFWHLLKKKFVELDLEYDDELYYNYLPSEYNAKKIINDLLIKRSKELILLPEVKNYILDFYYLFNERYLTFITARYHETRFITEQCMKQWFPEIENILIVFSHEDNKGNFLENYEYFVDDRLENLLSCINKNKKRLYLVNKPWNMLEEQKRIVDEMNKINSNFILRVDNLKEVFEDYCMMEGYAI